MSHASSDIFLRRLQRDDLPAALAIQLENYPTFLIEDEAAFASRLDAAAPYCFAATLHGALVGYLLAHGWSSQSPPAIGVRLARDAPSEVLFIHDLAIGSGGRGRAIGRKLIALAFERAAAEGLTIAELIAVEGAASYWRTLGFAEAAVSPSVAAKVVAYGTHARWMTRVIPSDAPVT